MKQSHFNKTYSWLRNSVHFMEPEGSRVNTNILVLFIITFNIII